MVCLSLIVFLAAVAVADAQSLYCPAAQVCTSCRPPIALMFYYCSLFSSLSESYHAISMTHIAYLMCCRSFAFKDLTVVYSTKDSKNTLYDGGWENRGLAIIVTNMPK